MVKNFLTIALLILLAPVLYVAGMALVTWLVFSPLSPLRMIL